MPKLDLRNAIRIKGAGGEILALKGQGFSWVKPSGDVDPILAYFQSTGADGAYYTPWDKSTLFQDAAGTIPVVNDGDPVGLMLDVSGNGHHAFQNVSAKRSQAFNGHLVPDGIDDGYILTNLNSNQSLTAGMLTRQGAGGGSDAIGSGTVTGSMLMQLNSTRINAHYWFASGLRIANTNINNALDEDYFALQRQSPSFVGGRKNKGVETVNTASSTSTTEQQQMFLFTRADTTSADKFNQIFYGGFIIRDLVDLTTVDGFIDYICQQSGVTL